MAANCDAANCPVTGDNHGARLGAYLGRLAQLGRDKLTLITSPSIQHFGDWVEQLIAESTGKEGKGILPVLREAPGKPDVYGPDRLFVGLEAAGEPLRATFIRSLEDAGHPVEIFRLHDPYDLGGQFFLWMMATAVAGRFLGINPFDQPDVEAAKAGAREAVEAYRTSGRLPEETPALSFGGVDVYGSVKGKDTMSALERFPGGYIAGGYIAVMAYVNATDETDILLQVFRTRLRDRYRVPVTVGYGPRFLHSTGQLHKGDSGRGFFIQITADCADDVPIPDAPGATASSITFGTLEAAQAMGDRQALLGERTPGHPAPPGPRYRRKAGAFDGRHPLTGSRSEERGPRRKTSSLEPRSSSLIRHDEIATKFAKRMINDTAGQGGNERWVSMLQS